LEKLDGTTFLIIEEGEIIEEASHGGNFVKQQLIMETVMGLGTF